jgi:hypothetical protein
MPSFISVYHDDLSAFGSSIVFSWPEYHSGTGCGGWLSVMKNLSYLILHCLKTNPLFLKPSVTPHLEMFQANKTSGRFA